MNYQVYGKNVAIFINRFILTLYYSLYNIPPKYLLHIANLPKSSFYYHHQDRPDPDAADKVAKELGINPADCKDLADVRKKVKAALSK